MKKFFKSPAFKFLLSLALSLALIFLTPDCLSFTWKLIIIGTLFLITNLSAYIGRVAILTHFFRIATGALFIFSGIIKSNDPTGFSIKLKEYFEIFKDDFSKMDDARPGAVAIAKKQEGVQKLAAEYTEKLKQVTDMGAYVPYQDTSVVFAEYAKRGKDPENMFTHMSEYFHDRSVGLAIIVCVSEVALGVLLLTGLLRTLTLWLLLAQIVFFTFLTFYSACYNKVTHCGCFGDFLKLTPWTSFGKDIALLVAIAFLFAGKENIKPLFKRSSVSWLITIIGVAVSIWFPIYCYNNLPVWDFLPFKDGANICEAKKPGPKYQAAEYMSYFFYKNVKTGEVKSFDQNSMPWQDTLNWAYVGADGEARLVKPEVDGPKITSYSILDMEGNEISDSLLLSGDNYFLLIMWDLEESNQDPDLIKKLNDFSAACEKEGIKFLAVTHDQEKDIKEYKFKNQAMFEFATCADDVQLKMMIRSNPGLMFFRGCVMVKKWHYNNLPAFADVKADYFK